MICKTQSLTWISFGVILSLSTAMAEGDSAKATTPAAAPAAKVAVATTPAVAPASTAAPASVPGKSKGRSCDEVQAEIQAKLEKKGVKNFTLSAVAPDAAAGGKIIGSCEGGSKRILYIRK